MGGDASPTPQAMLVTSRSITAKTGGAPSPEVAAVGMSGAPISVTEAASRNLSSPSWPCRPWYSLGILSHSPSSVSLPHHFLPDFSSSFTAGHLFSPSSPTSPSVVAIHGLAPAATVHLPTHLFRPRHASPSPFRLPLLHRGFPTAAASLLFVSVAVLLFEAVVRLPLLPSFSPFLLLSLRQNKISTSLFSSPKFQTIGNPAALCFLFPPTILSSPTKPVASRLRSPLLPP